MYWYVIIPILLLLLFCFSMYTFVSSLFEKMSSVKKTAIVSLLLSLFLFQLPDACSAFYWMPGSITYQLPLSLNVLAYALLIRFYTSKKQCICLLQQLPFFFYGLQRNNCSFQFVTMLFHCFLQINDFKKKGYHNAVTMSFTEYFWSF